MKTGARLRREFFDRPCLDVASELVGKWLVHALPGGVRVGGRIVEIEAYLGDGSDPAAHSHAGPTPRNQVMFGPAGRLYAYRSYGIHICVNVVCEGVGRGAALLLRALEPSGDAAALPAMRKLRGLSDDAASREIARGPGRLGQAMGFDLAHNGTNLLRGAIGVFEAPPASAAIQLATGPRVGITKAAELPYRFFDAGSRFVSPFRPGKPSKRPQRGWCA